MMAEISNTEW